MDTINKNMATSKLCLATVLLSLHAANSYILLTANLDDVHAIAKQIAASPVAAQLNKIIRRASTLFNQQVNKSGSNNFQQRTDENLDGGDDNFEIWKPELKGKDFNPIALRSRLSADVGSDISSEDQDNKENRVERRHSGDQDLVELGKNASFYLKSIKKIFENV